MHSPPLQPSSSRTSGTGSVITMWLEVTVSRWRSGRWPASAGPHARTTEPARTRAVRRRARGCHRRGEVDRRACPRRSARPAPGASIEARAPALPDARWPRRDRRPRRETGASRSEPGPPPRSTDGIHRELPARSHAACHLAPGVVVGGGGRDLQVSRPAKPGVDALFLAPSANALHRLAGGPRRPRARPSRRGVSEGPEGCTTSRSRSRRYARSAPLRSARPPPARSAPAAPARTRTMRSTCRYSRRRRSPRPHRRRRPGAEGLTESASACHQPSAVCRDATRYKGADSAARDSCISISSRWTLRGSPFGLRRVQPPSAPRTQALVLSASERSSTSRRSARASSPDADHSDIRPGEMLEGSPQRWLLTKCLCDAHIIDESRRMQGVEPAVERLARGGGQADGVQRKIQSVHAAGQLDDVHVGQTVPGFQCANHMEDAGAPAEAEDVAVVKAGDQQVCASRADLRQIRGRPVR